MACSARLRAASFRLALLVLRGWWVLRRPRSAGIRCLLRNGDAILLVRHTYGDRRWMLPGGRMRRGEDPVAAARREMREELGVSCRRWQLSGCLESRPGYLRRSAADSFRRHSTYYLQGEVETAELHPRRGELSDARWFHTNALPHERADSVEVAASAGCYPS